MAIFIYKGHSIHYREKSSDEDVLHHSFDRDIFFKGIPEYGSKEDDVIIDVGSHIGTFAILAAIKAPRGEVYAIEACRESFSILERNVTENHFDHVRTFHLALADREGQTKLYYDTEQGNWGHSIVKHFSNEGETVETTSLDIFLAANRIEKVNLIKFNCEGAEFRILLNTSRESLERIENYVILYHMDLESEYHIDDLTRLFRGLGFYTNIRDVSRDRKRGWMIVVNRGVLYKYYFTCASSIRWCVRLVRRIVQKIRPL